MHARVIVAYDGSERSLEVLPAAEAAADGFACPVEVVHVAERGSAGITPPNDVSVTTVPGDDPAASLLAEVHATEPDGLLCMTTRGRGAVGGLVFGSVAAELICDPSAPVLAVGPQCTPPSDGGPWSQMLVCLDGSATSASILPIARRWALELDLAVHLVHVAYPLPDPGSGDFTVPEEERISTAALVRTAAEFKESGIAATWEVMEDVDTTTGIVGQAIHGNVDVIAMATHGRTGLARLLAGSTAMDTVRRSPVPMLLVRPERLR